MADVFTEFLGGKTYYQRKEGKRTLVSENPDLLGIKTNKPFRKIAKWKPFQVRMVQQKKTKYYKKQVGDVLYWLKPRNEIFRTETKTELNKYPPKNKKFFVNKGGWLFGVKTGKKDWWGFANPFKITPMQSLGLRPHDRGTFKSKSLVQRIFGL